MYTAMCVYRRIHTYVHDIEDDNNNATLCHFVCILSVNKLHCYQCDPCAGAGGFPSVFTA